jgi:cytoskeletal protein CcmA (bactofilin family)
MGVLQLGADAQVEADLGYGDLYIQPGAVVIGALSPSAAQTVSSVPQWAKA